MDQRHTWVLNKAAEAFRVPVDFVQDYASRVMAQMTAFFQGGAKNPRGRGSSSNPTPSAAPTQTKKMLIFYTGTVEREGSSPQLGELELSLSSDVPFHGRHCCFFLRPGNRPISTANIEQELLFGYVQPDFLRSFLLSLRHVLLPALDAQSNWGQATPKEAQQPLLTGVEKFSQNISVAAESLHDVVMLRPPDPGCVVENDPAAVVEAAKRPELVRTYETLVGDWCKTVERIHVESDQVRQESDEVGPEAELQHWKCRMARFNMITDQLRLNQFRVIMLVLRQAKSRICKQWKRYEARITDAANEAKDNVKYLYTLDKFSQPLYRADPVRMLDAIPGLIKAIRMIHSIARYYNTSERMTALFVKITNQMITCCKKFLLADGSLWQQDRLRLTEKLHACLDLRDAYREHYQLTKLELQATPQGKQFDFSEVSIFGNFDLFCKRLQKIGDVVQTIEQFSSLKRTTLESMRGHLDRFDQIITSFQKKPYDLLNYRKPDFEVDYIEFTRSIHDLEISLQGYVQQCFQRTPTIRQSLELIRHFEAIATRASLKAELQRQLEQVFVRFGRDLEDVKTTYETFKTRPPLPRNAPPVAGNIAWARQLLRLIEEPMSDFQRRPRLMQHMEARHIIRAYNRIASALMEFEIRYHMGWLQAVDAASAGLSATLLVKHPKTQEIHVNFDPSIVRLIRETKYLQRMGLDVEQAAIRITQREDKYKVFHDQMLLMLSDRRALQAKALPIYADLGRPHLRTLDKTIATGLSTLTWNSMNIESYLHRVRGSISIVDELFSKANDLVDCRIRHTLHMIERTSLIQLPQEPVTITAFLASARDRAERFAELLDVKNLEVETAINDLILMLLRDAPATETALSESIGALIQHYYKDLFRSLVLCARRSLFKLRQAFTKTTPQCLFETRIEYHSPEEAQDSQSPGDDEFGSEEPEAETNAEQGNKTTTKAESGVASPVQMIPSAEEIRRMFVDAAKIILKSFDSVFEWGQRQPSSTSEPMPTRLHFTTPGADLTRSVEPGDLLSFFASVAADKDTAKAVLLLKGGLESFVQKLHLASAGYDVFDPLWKRSRENEARKFFETNPSLDAYEDEMAKYEAMLHQLSSLPERTQLCMMSLDMSHAQENLTKEIQAWKQEYAFNLQQNSKKELQAITDFMVDTTSKMGRPIGDLDDIRTQAGLLQGSRELEENLDLRFIPLEQRYALLAKYGVEASMEEKDMLDNLRYKWKQLKSASVKVQAKLIEVQPHYMQELQTCVSDFLEDVASYKQDYDTNGPMAFQTQPRVAMERLKMFQNSFEDRERKWNLYSSGELLFGLQETKYPELVRMKRELRLLQSLYGLYADVIMTVKQYEEVLWAELDLDRINLQLTDYQSKCKNLPRGMKEWQAFLELNKTINDFCEIMPLLQQLKQPAMRPRHWQRVMDITKRTFKLDADTFKLSHLLEAKILDYHDEIEEVTNGCSKESEIEAKLADIISAWVDQEFLFMNFKTRGEYLLKGDVAVELLTNLEDGQMALGSLLSNRYNAPFKPKLQEWNTKLTTSYEIIDQWLQVQALWIYLEAVFFGGDIAQQLPQEARLFSQIDKSWCKMMDNAREKKNVIQICCGDDTLKTLLPHLMEQLESCQKSLAGYLEKKRSLFPRFYFVSDPNLLEILGQANDPKAIEPHLKNIFDNIARLNFDRVKRTHIIGINSSEDEHIDLTRRVIAEGQIENWLDHLVLEMQNSVKSVVKDAVLQMDALDLDEFVLAQPAQVALLGVQLIWTRNCDLALRNAREDKNAMQGCNRNNAAILRTLVNMTTRELTKLERTKIETLVTIQVHQRDVFDELVRARVRSPLDFDWLKQTRFYWKADEEVVRIQITDIDFRYCYEFLGCTERLVITPLTDRCYITLAQAVGMFLGGAPAGPAGTGKTETVKDMGKALGKYVVVFNCSDQMDYRGLGKIYKGLAQSGSWGDFDEFNRIELCVLSVVAQQIMCILTAMRERKSSFVFTDGETVSLIPECGFFITMNPGYAGRQELPENLKALFRSVAMMVPDRKIIMRVKLAAAGFQENVMLSNKFFILYRLCEEQLSAQHHYDFGLRNILSVLRTAGTTKRTRPQENESQILMRVLRDMNLSKLVDEDEPLFIELINDLFPGQAVEPESYPKLQAGIQRWCDELHLVNHQDWNLKLVQLYETAQVRHGIMVLGESGSGKTKCIDVLCRAMTDCGLPHKQIRMNPKAITATQMFGRLDVATNEWTDGIFAVLWRKACRKDQDYIWLILDGPVDALWIENLNTVLDDNKTLTLANSDRIRMSPKLKLIFEVANLDNASPATVSRAGMIYLSRQSLGWKPVVQALTQRRPDGASLWQLFVEYCDRVFLFLRDNCKEVMQLSEVAKTTTCFNLLEGLLPAPDSNQTLSQDLLTRYFVFALAWSLGALLEQDGRAKLHRFLQDECQLDLPHIPGGSQDTLYEYRINEQGDWEHWKETLPPFEYPKTYTPPFASLFVPTVDNLRMDFLVHLIANQRKHVLFIGESGTAKTVTVLAYLNKQDPEHILTQIANFSSATTPLIFQRNVESLVEKRVGVFGPPGNKRMILFVDDINMPLYNEWGDQVTAELFRQLIEEHGFYNLDKPGLFTEIVDLQYIGAMPHPGGGRNDIPPRLKRHFCIFNVTLPSADSVRKIYGSIIEGHFCEERQFNDEVRTTAARVTGLTQELWTITKTKMLPTPSKFHYMFNLRDLSRVFQGMLRADAEVIQSTTSLLQLWRHECARVLYDKLTNEKDRTMWDEFTQEVLARQFGEPVADEVARAKFFVDFMRDAPDMDQMEDDAPEPEVPHIYEAVYEGNVLSERVKIFQDQYNEQNRRQRMNLVFFDDALAHLTRIYRILCTPRGNALLVGVGGSGKQSLTRLAASIAGCKIFQIQITKNYNANNLLEDLKNVYRMAGEGQPVVFIFTDSEIKDENFLEYINSILTSGQVPALFPKDEMDTIISDMRPIMKKERPKEIDTYENLWTFFIDRVRDNLHVVLCFSPIGEKFRNRARMFPGLISGCTVDWFSTWPKEALLAVSNESLASFDITCTPEVKSALGDHMAFVHHNVSGICVDYFNRLRRHAYVTPKSYLSFIKSYCQMYNAKRNELNEMKERLQTGLDKLLQAQTDVENMSEELVHKEAKLKVAQENAATMLVEIQKDTAAAEKVKAEVQAVKDKLAGEAEVIAAQKAEAERDLEAAKPALEEAVMALASITSGDIATLKKLGSPPNLIMRIMDGVLILRRYPLNAVTFSEKNNQIEPSWNFTKRMLNETGLLQSLLTFPKDDITDETCELLFPYLEMEDFNRERAASACGSLAGLCSWIRAMVTYHFIAKEVEPKRLAVAKAEREMAAAMANLQAAEEELADKQRALDLMREKYDSAMAEKQRLQDEYNLTRKRMDSANALITGLGGEKIRWTQQIQEFDRDIEQLVGDVSLACAFLSYAGPFNSQYREILIEGWKRDLHERNIPMHDNLKLTQFCADDATISEWNVQGLPTDDLSIQNGIIVTSADRFPLLIDPQGQGKTWIMNKETNLVLTNLNHKYFRMHLEDAISQGKSLLIEDLGEELDPVLDPLLEKQIVKTGARSFQVRVGDKEVDYDQRFKLFMTTKLPNPHYSPEISARTAIIDFTVTIRGLEQQILGLVILKERAELEERRKQVVAGVSENKKMRQQLERDLLFRLTESKKNLLDDDELIEVLQKTKTLSEQVAEALRVGEETERSINEARQEYLPVATRASINYFLIAETSLVSNMYQTSLSVFLKLFEKAIDDSEESPIPAKRIENIIKHSTRAIYFYVQRGLFSEHKILYVLLLCLKLEMNSKRITQQHFNMLVKGGAALDITQVRAKPFPWIPENAWLNVIALSGLPEYRALADQIAQNEAGWRAWYDTETPETQPLPDNYDRICDLFGKLLFVRAWREDRMILAANRYIESALGPEYVNPPGFDLEATWMESDPASPIIFLLSLGSDPTSTIHPLAQKHRIPLYLRSMGQGQDIPSRRDIQEALTNGGWVYLQNCHLDLNFMDEVERLLLNIREKNPHKSFRMILTTESHPKFPIGLLQMAIKVAFEPPMGVKSGLERSYAWLVQEFFDAIEKPQWKTLLYTMAFLHTTVQERRKFGPLGWNVPYEFNHSDFAASVEFLRTHMYQMDAARGIEWPTVQYMICEVHYGGRITDDFDRVLMNTYGRRWLDARIFNPSFRFGDHEPYPISQGQKVEDVVAFVNEDLPAIDRPEAFGMHSNADITYRTNQSNKILDTILSIQPKDASSGGETPEEAVRKLSVDLLKKLPPDFIMIRVKEQLAQLGSTAPLHVFLRQEVERMQRVIATVRRTLLDLQDAIAGTIIMSQALQTTLASLHDAKVPEPWLKISWPGATIGFWFSDLLMRTQQYADWLQFGRPKCYWMTGFFNPQGFLTAMKQEITRAHKWALDTVILCSQILRQKTKDEIRIPPEEGLYIHGLFLEGATWDHDQQTLIDSAPKVLFSNLPVLHVSATNVKKPTQGFYVCPVYRTPRRTGLNYIFDVNIPTKDDPDKWILRGVALLCSKQ